MSEILTEQWLRDNTLFEEKSTYGWNGNGSDYRVPIAEGGSRTENKDFVYRLPDSDDDFIIRFTTWDYYKKEKPDKNMSLHYGEWYEEFNNDVPCFDPQNIEVVKLAFYVTTGLQFPIK